MNRNTLLVILIVAGLFFGLKWWLSPPPPPGAPTAKIDPTPATINFGEVYVGQTGKGACVWNNTTVKPATTVSAGSADAGFGFDATTFTAGNLPVGGNTGNLTFTFSPSEDKAYTGTGQLVVTDNKTSKVNLKGSGVYAKAKGALALSIPQPAGTVPGTPAAKFLDFGKVKVGNSGTLPVTIANTDLNNPITVTAAWSNGSQGFAVANPPGNTFAIPKASSLSVNITFTPKAVQKYTDAVTFADAAGNNLCGVVTEGEGTE